MRFQIIFAFQFVNTINVNVDYMIKILNFQLYIDMVIKIMDNNDNSNNIIIINFHTEKKCNYTITKIKIIYIF